MDYVGDIFRPPSEAFSLLLQVTVGCSHNRCAFCNMYRAKRFHLKDRRQISRDIDEAASHGPRFDRLFLCDGDALILSTDRLLSILQEIRQKLPWILRVSCYGDTRSILPKGIDQLRALKDAGLSLVYHGLESGDDKVLAMIDKGGNSDEALQSARLLREADIAHSVIVLLGIGGLQHSRSHITASARVLSAMDPGFAAALTTTVVPDTPLADMQMQGRWQLPDRFALLQELYDLLSGLELSQCRFSSNHASNYLALRGDLPKDQEQMLNQLRQVLNNKDSTQLRPEWARGL